MSAKDTITNGGVSYIINNSTDESAVSKARDLKTLKDTNDIRRIAIHNDGDVVITMEEGSLFHEGLTEKMNKRGYRFRFATVGSPIGRLRVWFEPDE